MQRIRPVYAQKSPILEYSVDSHAIAFERHTLRSTG
jgi:hypothetical protein